MYILMLIDRMDIGGAETHILTLSEQLVHRGHRVCVLCAGGCYQERLKAAGVRCEYFPADRRTPLSVLRCAIRLRRLVRRERFDIIHAHTRMTATLACRLIRRIPTVTTAHLPFPATHWQRHVMQWGKHILAVSEDIREHLMRAYGCEEDDITVTRNGIDLQSYTEQQGGEDIVHISRLDKDRSRCALLLCRIAPRLLAGHPSRCIHISGDGDDIASVQAAAAAANIALGREGVCLYGRQTDIPQQLCRAAVFVGVSRAALEAMSMRIYTILCGNEGYGGMVSRDTFEDLSRGNFCARGCAEAEEEQLLFDLSTALTDADKRHTVAREVYDMLAAKYNAEDMARDAVEVYRQVLCPKSAFIIGYYGYGNFGDEATLSVLKSALMQRNIYKISVFSKHSSEDGSHIGRYHIFKLVQKIRTSDVILFGGGNLLQNATSARSLLVYRALICFSILCGKRIVMISGGIGELYGKRTRRRIGRLLRGVSAFYTRSTEDAEDIRHLLQGASSAPIRATADACFSLPPTPREQMRRRIIFILKRGASNADLMAFAAAVDHLRRGGYSIALLTLFDAQDGAFCFSLAHHFSLPLLHADNYLSFVQQTRGAALIISERLHGAVFSLLCHIPCFLCDRTSKCRRLIAQVACEADALHIPSPLLAFHTLCTLQPTLSKRIMYSARHAVRASLRGRVHLLTHLGARKKEIGGVYASDFGQLLNRLRRRAAWESYVFYEEG